MCNAYDTAKALRTGILHSSSQSWLPATNHLAGRTHETSWPSPYPRYPLNIRVLTEGHFGRARVTVLSHADPPTRPASERTQAMAFSSAPSVVNWTNLLKVSWVIASYTTEHAKVRCLTEVHLLVAWVTCTSTKHHIFGSAARLNRCSSTTSPTSYVAPTQPLKSNLTQL